MTFDLFAVLDQQNMFNYIFFGELFIGFLIILNKQQVEQRSDELL